MAKPRRTSKQSKQAGGTFLGIVLGLIVGLAIAVVVALYITRAPSPFVSKVAPPADNNASQPQQFDPNRALQGKTPGQPVTPQAAQPAPPNTAPGQAANPSQPPLLPEPQIVEVPSSNNNGNGSPSASNNAADNGVAVAPKPAEPAPPPAKKPQTAANGSAAPPVANGDAQASAPTHHGAQASAAATPPKAAQAPKGASSATTTAAKPTSGADANTGYFLQVGAYKTEADAEQQRARLGFQGFESKVSKRDVSGVTYFRVRIGPFSKFEDMNSARQRLSDAGVDTAVIRFTKQ
ncbi:cell division protein [Burkholderia pseudomallei]|uniref:SPOR domain-containing protein n=1 Tax=Burkholderia pseudomallei TaxID=28450 RepID=UPI0009765FAD|nr:SPOR domain-containing protein [Burkholderia pseudomallei]OND07570.1 cell division protein [Burkholderia pseudomallei]